jgi:hypothetical protein
VVAQVLDLNRAEPGEVEEPKQIELFADIKSGSKR